MLYCRRCSESFCYLIHAVSVVQYLFWCILLQHVLRREKWHETAIFSYFQMRNHTSGTMDAIMMTGMLTRNRVQRGLTVAIGRPLIKRKSSLVKLLAAAALLSSILQSCASNNYPPAPKVLDSEGDNSYGYIIGAGDRLNVYVWGYEDLSDGITVRPDGKITTKLVEDLRASGQTPSQLARELENRYTEFVKKPVVTVSVDDFVGSSNQQVRIMGAWETPKSITYTPDMTLLDLVIEAGGVSEFANGNAAVLVRKEGDTDSSYSLRIDDLIRKGDIGANVPLLPGDIVIVPENRF